MSGMYKVEGEQVVALPSTLTHYSDEVGKGLRTRESYESGIELLVTSLMNMGCDEYPQIFNQVCSLWCELGTIQQLRKDFIGIYGPGLWWEKKYTEDRKVKPSRYMGSLKLITRGVTEKAINGGTIPLDIVKSVFLMYQDMDKNLEEMGEVIERIYLKNRWTEMMFDLSKYGHISRWWDDKMKSYGN